MAENERKTEQKAVSLDTETIARLQRLRERRARDAERPSFSAALRIAAKAGLDRLEAADAVA